MVKPSATQGPSNAHSMPLTPPAMATTGMLVKAAVGTRRNQTDPAVPVAPKRGSVRV